MRVPAQKRANGNLKSWKCNSTGDETLPSPSGAKLGVSLRMLRHFPPRASFKIRDRHEFCERRVDLT